jgi:rhodanese-related sulfurtransferase
LLSKILTLLFILGISLYADFEGIKKDKMDLLHSKGAPIIDIRTPEEWKETGIIKDSHKIMFFSEDGKYDIPKFLDALSKAVKDKNQSFILVCRTASRTKMVGNFLSKEVGYKNVKELTGGITYSGVKLVK